MPDLASAAARRALPLLDLTSLHQDDTPTTIRELCARATTPHGSVAAVCVPPELADVAVAELADRPVRVATVANFPHGLDELGQVAIATASAIAAGVDEVDVVVPWHAHLDGDLDAVERLVSVCAARAHTRPLKAILETGSHPDPETTRAIADAALRGGAAFLKTSTGKYGPGASLDAARVLLEAVREHGSGGVKVAGGVRSAEQAATYLALAGDVLGPDWATPDTFRIGASSLLDDLLRHLDA